MESGFRKTVAYRNCTDAAFLPPSVNTTFNYTIAEDSASEKNTRVQKRSPAIRRQKRNTDYRNVS